MTKRVALISGTAWYLWNFRRRVIEAFAEDGWQIDVIAGPDAWSDKLRALPKTRVTDWPASLDGANPLQEARALMHVRKALRQSRPNIVFNNGIKANVYGGLAARWLRIPYVNNVSGLGMRMRAGDRKARLLGKLYVLGSAKAQALLIQNPDDLNFLQDRGLAASIPVHRTMGSGVDLDHFKATPMQPGQPRRLIFVGRLQRDKGITDLVDAMRHLSPETAATLTVVGDTTHANQGAVSDETLAHWQSTTEINFVGRQDDIRPMLDNAHALIMPSQGGEGMPKTILEAAAAGRPAIVSDIDGCRDCIIPGKTGWLAPACDPKGLAQVIDGFARLSDAEIAAAAKAARTHAEEHFSDQKIIDVCLDLARANLTDTRN
ncbi:MAG: glycosyltransferase family 4 protein [Pseudomonadota bacterium]